ncbi:unnamed protein product [Protopolystoma xenopodis]|uniref:Uncharacterized protein n=1 Tax=Protopolystoma xenopodis TaxID=117903 RepID=A0A3S5B106_9PLAT|nr:unnamed protein product [Protopolystoma xenopodis]
MDLTLGRSTGKTDGHTDRHTGRVTVEVYRQPILSHCLGDKSSSSICQLSHICMLHLCDGGGTRRASSARPLFHRVGFV